VVSDHRRPTRAALPPGAAALADAARAVRAVAIEGQSADKALAAFHHSANRAAIRAIALGSLRWYLRLAPALEALLKHPAKLTGEVRCLLIVGAHQIEYSRHAPEVAVDRAVEAARLMGAAHAAGLVNAVLRRFVAERGALLAKVDATSAARSAHPGWLAAELSRAWPAAVERILAAGNEPPPMILRVDLTRTSIERYLEELAGAGIAAERIDWAAAAVRLEHPEVVGALPGFSEGRVSVQDAGAQLAAALLDAHPGMRILDACAAPGGKTGHILELVPGLAELVAVEIDAARAGRLRETTERLAREATVCVADMRHPHTFWDGRPFDRILVDAPCSATGVIRRHPDIKLLRRPEDIGNFARVQLQMLRSALGMLAEGGRLLYSTCSVLPAENEEVVQRLLKSEAAVRVAPFAPALQWPPGAQERVVGMQLLPGGRAGTDGFYYACLEKTASGP